MTRTKVPHVRPPKNPGGTNMGHPAQNQKRQIKGKFKNPTFACCAGRTWGTRRQRQSQKLGQNQFRGRGRTAATCPLAQLQKQIWERMLLNVCGAGRFRWEGIHEPQTRVRRLGHPAPGENARWQPEGCRHMCGSPSLDVPFCLLTWYPTSRVGYFQRLLLYTQSNKAVVYECVRIFSIR